MNAQLTNQNVVIIGASSGVGLAVAQLIAASGARITIASRSQERLASAAQEIGCKLSNN